MTPLKPLSIFAAASARPTRTGLTVQLDDATPIAIEPESRTAPINAALACSTVPAPEPVVPRITRRMPRGTPTETLPIEGDRDPAREPASGPVIARLVLRPEVPSGALSPSDERAILAVLSSRPANGETVELAFRRIERELCLLFAKLTPLEARTLRRRLELPAEHDALAVRFGRMVVTRRLRLLTFLADARRREALARSA